MPARPVSTNPAPRALVADAAWAMLGTTAVMALLVGHGGIGATVGGSDLFGYFVPKYEAGIRALFVEHRLPLWNPHEFMGIPFLGNPQFNVLYPPTWICFGLLPTRAALQAFYGMHTLVLAWGLVAYLRRHGVSRPVSVLGLFVVMGGLFTGRAASGIDHPAFLAALSWVPWILLFWEKSVVAVRPWVGWMAIAVCAQWLAGYPDFSLSSPLLLGVLALVGPAAPPDTDDASTWVRRCLVLAAGLVLGAALAGIQILSTAEAVAQSSRGLAGIDHSQMRDPMLPGSLRDIRHWAIDHFGPATLALAVLALVRPTRTRIAWALALGFTLLIGWPPLRWLYFLPVLSSIRFPFAWELLAGIFWAALACAAVADGMRSPLRRRRAATAALALWAGIQSAVEVWHAPVAFSQRAPDAVLHEERARKLEGLLDRLPPGTRIASRRDAAAGAPLRHGLPFAGGYEPAMQPSRLTDLLDEFYRHGQGTGMQPPVFYNPPLASLMGVGVVVCHRNYASLMRRAGFRKIGDFPPDEVIFHQPAIPRVRIVHEAEVAGNGPDALARVAAWPHRFRRSVVLETSAAELPAHRVGDSGRESARVVSYEPERVVVEARLKRPGWLVLTDAYAPNWVAEVDGTATEVLPADFLFRAVPLGSGTHRVVFEFRSAAVRAGCVVSALAAIAVGLLLWPRGPTELLRRADPLA